MHDDYFNVGHIEFDSEIYGPGKRTVIWFQGCTLGCKGCWNIQYQSPEPAILIPTSELLQIILRRDNGVTFLGGEPLLQINNLLWLVKKLKRRDIHVMLYTGYELDEIDNDPVKKELCQMADILIPGRYNENLRDTKLLWRGSKNQPLIYRNDKEMVTDENQAEITIQADGTVTCLGYPSDGLLHFIRTLDYSNF